MVRGSRLVLHSHASYTVSMYQWLRCLDARARAVRTARMCRRTGLDAFMDKSAARCSSKVKISHVCSKET